MILCHPLNVRHQQVVIERYANSCIKFGNCQQVRGEAIACRSPSGGPPWLMITYGSFSRGVYLAHKRNGGNANVIATIEAGLMLDEYHELMPDDVVNWLKFFYNNFHGGAGVSPLEMIVVVLATDAEFKVYANTHSIPLSRSGKGENSTDAQFAVWLSKTHSETFSTKEVFHLCRSALCHA